MITSMLRCKDATFQKNLQGLTPLLAVPRVVCYLKPKCSYFAHFQNRFTSKSAHFQVRSLHNVLTSKYVHFKICSLPNAFTSKSAHFQIGSLHNSLTSNFIICSLPKFPNTFLYKLDYDYADLVYLSREDGNIIL